jgi:multidrug efflux system membrane fusion protein
LKYRVGAVRRSIRLCLLGLLPMALMLAALTACKQEDTKAKAVPPQRPPAPVSVAKAVARDLPIKLESLGVVEPSAKVVVTSQISGQLLAVYFEEGKPVNKGDLLFSIDPTPYQVALKIAAANLKKEEAQVKEYQQEVNRRRHMVKRKYISQEDFQKLQTQLLSQVADVEAAKAQLEKAQHDLDHCQVKAPLSGRASRILIQPGSQINAGASGAVLSISRIQPAYVSFSLPESDLFQVREHQAKGPLKVEAWHARGEKPLSGELNYIDEQVERDTGSISLRAQFPNSGSHLWPGLSVRVALTLYVEKGAIVVPSQAVQLSPRGQFVYVLKAGDTVEMRPTSITRMTGGLAVLKSGVKPGEDVVTDGHLMLYPGAKVVKRQVPALDKSLNKQRKAK